jgi:hypothetical protein
MGWFTFTVSMPPSEAKPASCYRIFFNHAILGSTAASAVVRRALASNPPREPKSMDYHLIGTARPCRRRGRRRLRPGRARSPKPILGEHGRPGCSSPRPRVEPSARAKKHGLPFDWNRASVPTTRASSAAPGAGAVPKTNRNANCALA